MKELNGVWWALNQDKVAGKLSITDENRIKLVTYEKLYDSNIVCGFAQGRQITLVDVILDRTDIYEGDVYKDEIEISKGESTKLKYYTYTYLADLLIFDHVYDRKGDIRLSNVSLYFTNLDKWVNWKIEEPKISEEENHFILKIPKSYGKKIHTEKFNLSVENLYLLTKAPYEMNINGKVRIFVNNIGNKYISSVQEIIRCLKYFLILCTGDNINVEKIEGVDFFNRNIELILANERSNFENRVIFKNIIKFKDIENNFENIINNWLKVYEENELLMANFIKLNTTEDLLASEYMNLTNAIDSSHLLVTGKTHTKEQFAEIVKKLLKETNFILDFSEEQIEKLAIKIKDTRRYFVHSNKTQRKLVNHNVTIIQIIEAILIEAIRARIMMNIGIDKNIIAKYYRSVEKRKSIKESIINDLNEDEKIVFDESKKGKKIMNPLSKKDKNYIAQLNAMLGTRYRESELNLENEKDLIEALENVTAEYMDYLNYWLELETILENFDQSLEVYHPEEYFKKLKGEKMENELVEITMQQLYAVSDNMDELAEFKEAECKELWKYALLRDKRKVQNYFLGDISNYTEEQITEAIEETFENVTEIDYNNQVQEDAENFAKTIKKYLENP